MASYKPYIKKSNGTAEELPLDATTLGGIDANGFARASHTHDNRYYTESEIDAKLKTIQTSTKNAACKLHRQGLHLCQRHKFQ